MFFKHQQISLSVRVVIKQLPLILSRDLLRVNQALDLDLWIDSKSLFGGGKID